MDENENEIDWAELEAIVFNGVAEAECGECGYFANVEPDADGPCPECGVGSLTSPLRKHGLI